MGFGILFIGYFITYIGALVIPISNFTYVLGAGVILYSLKNLIKENKMFLASAILSGILELLSIAILILEFFAPSSTISSVLSTIQGVSFSALNIILLIAIFLIAKQVGAPKIQSKAIVNLVVSVISFTLLVISVLVINSSLAVRCFYVSYLASVIYSIFGLVAVFNCYASICYEGDENMEKEATGIKPLDFLNKALNKAMNKNKDIDKTGKKK